MIGYKRLSRPGKQTRITRTAAGDYTIGDQQSTNGTMVQGRLLDAGESVPVNEAIKLAMGGTKETAAMGSCQLTVSPALKSRSSLVIASDQSALKLLDRAALTEAWPTLDEDATATWALVGESIAIGISSGTFDIGCQHSEPVLILIYDNGWQITPAQKGPDSNISIDGTTLMNIMPLAASTRVDVQGLWFSLIQEGGL